MTTKINTIYSLLLDGDDYCGGKSSRGRKWSICRGLQCSCAQDGEASSTKGCLSTDLREGMGPGYGCLGDTCGGDSKCQGSEIRVFLACSREEKRPVGLDCGKRRRE